MSENKEEILYRGALRRIKESGVRFTVDDLCKDLKMSKKTFYVFFPTKGDFGMWIYKRAFELFTESYNQHPSFPSTEAKKLIRRYVDLLLITDPKVLNRYSLVERVKTFEETNMKEKRKDFKDYILSTSLKKFSSHSSFYPSLESALRNIALTDGKDALFNDYYQLLTEL